MRFTSWFALGLVAAASAIAPSAHAENVKVGLSKLISYPGVPIALERGYFKQQGLDVEMVFFDSAQPISVGVASGDIQFGVAGMSASFYTLAGQGQLKLIAASSGEEPGFYNLTFLASNKAYDAGLKTVKDLPGHDLAITQLGTSLHYALGIAAEKYGFAISTVTIRPLQSNSNVIAALTGGTVAAAVMPGTPTLKPVDAGEVKRIGWTGDITPNWMGSAVFSGTKTLNGQADMVKRFLTAYRMGTRDYYNAFTTADGKRQDGADAPAVLKLLADFSGVPADAIDKSTPFIDRDGRVNVGDVAHQVAWYKSQGLIKGDFKAEDLVDMRYAMTTPAK